MKTTIARRLLCAAAFAFLATPVVHADAWPTRPVRIIMPFPTGTGPDSVMRMVGERLTQIWGQQVVVENKPGGNGWIALDAVKRAAPDGYTLMQVDAPPITVHPYLFKKIPYDPVKDFDPIGPIYRTYYFVTVAADSPFRTVGDLVNAAKAKPSVLTYGSSGNGGNLHLGGAMLEQAAGVKMTHVPYKDTPQIYIDISKGDVTWAMGTASTTQPLFQAKKIKYLAISALKRSPLFPDVPTIAEAGGPSGVELQTWVALYAPHGVPKAIIDKVNMDLGRVMHEPQIRERLTAVGFEGLTQSPDELRKMAASDAVKYKALLKGLNISLD